MIEQFKELHDVTDADNVVLDTFTSTFIDVGHALKNANFDTIRDQVKNLSETINTLKEGSRNLSAE
jgi:hypothetical protein